MTNEQVNTLYTTHKNPGQTKSIIFLFCLIFFAVSRNNLLSLLFFTAFFHELLDKFNRTEKNGQMRFNQMGTKSSAFKPIMVASLQSFDDQMKEYNAKNMIDDTEICIYSPCYFNFTYFLLENIGY